LGLAGKEVDIRGAGEGRQQWDSVILFGYFRVLTNKLTDQ